MITGSTCAKPVPVTGATVSLYEGAGGTNEVVPFISDTSIISSLPYTYESQNSDEIEYDTTLITERIKRVNEQWGG